MIKKLKAIKFLLDIQNDIYGAIEFVNENPDYVDKLVGIVCSNKRTS